MRRRPNRGPPENGQVVPDIRHVKQELTMPQTDTLNRRFVLAERPNGEPTLATLRLETVPVPAPAQGQMLLRSDYLSLDPYMRGRMRS